MRTLSIVAVLLLLGGCISVVTNEMTFDEDFQDTNPGLAAAMAAVPDEAVEAVFKYLPSTEKMASMSPEERGSVIDEAVAEAREAGEIPPAERSAETGTSSPVTGQSGYGYIVNVFSQAGTTTQDVSAQVDAAVRAALAANSPNADLDAGGDDKKGVTPEPTPKPVG